MSQTINQAVQYGSLCFLRGGLAALPKLPVEGSEVRQETAVRQGGGTPTSAAAAQRCILLQPKVRHPFYCVAQAVLCAIRGWRQ